MRPTRSIPLHCTRMSSKRHYTARHDSGLSSTNNSGPRRPPKWQRQQQRATASGDSSNNNKRPPRPTHFLALPIGHHPELRNAISALTSSWLAHEPPIEGLDPSIVVHPRRLHLTLGVMSLTTAGTSSSSNRNHPTANSNSKSNSEQQGQGQGQGQEEQRDLASASALLSSLAPRVRALLAQNPLRVPLGRLAIMQSDPASAHVLYAEPDLRSTDGRRLRAVCGGLLLFHFVMTDIRISYPFPPASSPERACGMCSTDLMWVFRASSWCVQRGWLYR
jgi:AKAP7 2'5' RNA ligase-like domain